MTRTLAEAERLAEDIVFVSSLGSGLVNFIPVVGGTASLSVDMVMARKVADAFGIGFFDEAALKSHLATAVGAAVAGKVAAHFLHVVPGVGSLACAVMSGKITYKVGECLIKYFRDHSPLAC